MIQTNNMTTKDIGTIGERLAINFLKKNKYKILEKNGKKFAFELEFFEKRVILLFKHLFEKTTKQHITITYNIQKREEENESN